MIDATAFGSILMTATHPAGAAGQDLGFTLHDKGPCGDRLPVAAGVAGGAVGIPSGLSRRPFRPRVDLIVPDAGPRVRQARHLVR